MRRATQGLRKWEKDALEHLLWGIVLLFLPVGLLAQETLTLPGLQEPVEILKDRWGIAHIYAETEHDLFFAQGWNAARDRLFQLELWRRQATGTVAEILGPREIERDVGTRLFRFRRDLEQELKHYHPNGVQIIGSYVFLWGQKQERTPTWYGMLLEDGSKTETIDVMHHLWTGEWPENRAPRVKDLELDGKNAHKSVTVKAGKKVGARIKAEDPEDDALTYTWSVMRESEATQTGGDREEIPDTLEGTVVDEGNGAATVTAPEEPGNYRLFVYVHDDQGNAGHANLPFRVK